MPKSVYIHIPFCKSKCKYCSFTSFSNTELITGYMYSLMKEISENYSEELLDTLYFGGGTPSLIPADLINKVIKKFKLSKNAEVTLELNPDDSDSSYFKALKEAGVNRLSIGSQTFNDNILQMIGRRHNAEQIKQTIKDAQKCGYTNISADLIYGLPTQTINDLEYDIENLCNLGIQHISTYGLKIEEGAYFGKNLPQNLPNDDLQADMYERVNELLEQAGFRRYEISNFAKEGYESRHNLNYWNNEE